MLTKENINKDLWEIIKVHYEKECYTDCLKDACLYVIQLVQEKSDAEDLDGEKLITNVFSEKSPKLLINNNQTQTEKDEQRGFGFILRGIICAIRNPISHKNNFKFTKEEVDSILMFISSYILPRLDDSKDFGYVDDWFDFIFISNNNDSQKYSDTILESIPKKEKYDLMIKVVENLSLIKENKYKYFINKLLEELSKKEKDEIILLLNKKLIKVGDGNYLRMLFNHFEPVIWKKLDKLVKIRIEEIVFNSIKEGKSFKNPKTLKIDYTGSLGTWTSEWIEYFSNKNEIIELLYDKLINSAETDYVLVYFSSLIEERKSLEKNSKKIIKGLNYGYKGYKRLLDDFMFFDDGTDELLKKFRSSYDSFKMMSDEFDEVECDSIYD